LQRTRLCIPRFLALSPRVAAIVIATVFVLLAFGEPAGAATATFLPSADSYVQSDRATTNYGLATGLRIDGSPTTNAYLRFDLSGISGTLTGATLKVYARTSSSTPITLHGVADNLWGETTIKYANAPLIGAQVAKSGSLVSGTSVSLDAKPLIAGNGTVSMALKTTSSTSRTVDSREGQNKPQLVVTSDVPPVNTAPPTVAGVLEQGQTLTADPGSWSGTGPISYSYRWRRCDTTGGTCADIAGATGKTYLLGTADIGATLRVAVTATSAAGPGSAVSGPTGVVLAAAPTNSPVSLSPPTISGTATQFQTLSADPGVWNGTQSIGYAYQWRRCDPAGGSCVDITQATSQAYPLTAQDVGSALRVTVTASNSAGSATATSAPTTVVTTASDPVIAAAGDIACDPTESSFNDGLGTSGSCRQKYTSDLLLGTGLTRVLTLGDAQYENGALEKFQLSYDQSWGRVRGITAPVPGNHEYSTGGATGYFDYFNGLGNSTGPAGDRTRGYYSYNLGAWHLIALNSNCSQVGGCGAGSPQEQWLRSDLTANTAACTLAYWHHPLFSSGVYSPGISATRPLFQALYDYGADVVLNGHDHNYERFAPQDPAGSLDLARGIREFIVGTGGRGHNLQGTPIPNSEVRNSDSFGVLRLTLHPNGFDWQFAPEAGKTFTDAGNDSCEGTSPDTTPPTAPGNLTAVARSSSAVDLNWTAASDAVGVVSYQIYRNGALLATTGTNVTSYTDATVIGSSSYSYEVKARDAAGNVSAASNTASATTPANLAALTFAPAADARVSEASPAANYATSSLRADGGSDPDVESYLRFSVTGVVGTVRSAALRVYAYTGTGDGPAVFTTDSTWVETALTWANRPTRISGAIADKGAIATGSWVEYDVTSAVTGNGSYGFVLATISSDGVDIYSREATSLRPELFVTLG
jgi:calcineurin-like phosphoesterase family protein